MTSYPFRSALITGASSGIGEAMAVLLGQSGVACVLVARRGDRLQEIADRYSNFEVLEAVRPQGSQTSSLGWIWSVEGSFMAVGAATGGKALRRYQP